MRKKLLVPALALLLALSACMPPPRETESPAPTPPTPTEVMSPWLEDYDHFWALVEENYALYAAAERITGNDFQVIEEKFRPAAAEVSDADGLKDVLIRCVEQFRGTGHFALIIRPEEYASYVSLYGRRKEDSPKGAHLYDRLNNPASIAYYGVEPDKLVERMKEQEESGNRESTPATGTGDSGNLTFGDYPEQRAAYVAIGQMTAPWENNDGERLDRWFRRLQGEGYENCILDIRGNGGGNSGYWQNYIVPPNLKEPLASVNYGLVRGSESEAYWRAVGFDLGKVDNLPIDTMPALHPDDLAGATSYIDWSSSYEPMGEPVFTGRFWLLVDEAVYSSSERMAAFCKSTGFATLVGEPTGGDGIGTDPLIFALPNSGICFRFSAENGLNPDGSCNEEYGTMPDILIEPNQDALEVCEVCLTAIDKMQ